MINIYKMTPKTINTFISSINRENNEPVHNFNVDFTDDIIKCNQDQYIRVNVISFDMINTMYNIKDTQIEVKMYDIATQDYISTFVCPIPDGNYSVYSIKKWFETNVDEEAVLTITDYNIAQNTFTFKLKNNLLQDDRYYELQPCRFLGINEKKIIPYDGEITGDYINLVNYNKVILRTDSLTFDVSCIENVRYTNNANKLKFSNILFWTSKQDVEPFRNITYTNADGGNSFNVMLQDKFVNQMNLQLTNELGEYITDAPDYLLVLQFSIHDKDEWFKKTLVEVANNVKQIFVMILWIMENYLQIL